MGPVGSAELGFSACGPCHYSAALFSLRPGPDHRFWSSSLSAWVSIAQWLLRFWNACRRSSALHSLPQAAALFSTAARSGASQPASSQR